MKPTLKGLKFVLTACFSFFIGMYVHAQDENGLCLHYNFEGVKGTSVPDASGSGATATLKNQAQVVEMGKYHVLDLGNGSGYLDMGQAAGEIFRQNNAYTISMYYRVNDAASLSGAGFFLWNFSTSASCDATNGKYSAYRLNAQRIANSTGGFNNETGAETGSPSQKGKWIHVLYRQNNTTGALYINGTLAASLTSTTANTTNFTTSVPYAWIGRPPFSADNYLRNTLVYGIRLYNKALTTSEISQLSALTDDLEYAYRYGTPGDFTALQTKVEEAETFISQNGNAYPAIALALYQDEVEMAKSLITEGLASQTVINQQITYLNNALAQVKKSAGFVFDDEGCTDGYDTDRGFKHPGALHTEADFDRIKAQIQSGSEYNSTVKSAYNVLTNAEFAQSGAATYPVETIIRGGGVGENYINAARGATIAYQNALRWKIDGNEANAKRAVEVLNAWARTTKGIGGNSNYALAAGLYGYAFANAAELMRDYEGWAAEDFQAFRRWMLDVWYPSCIGFLRGRNGTWENADRWWQCPGHYWSNWGLCNAVAVISIGILCDDVFIYNQGLSYFKYDQVGTFTDPRTANPILNDGLTEFLGNLVVTTAESELETGAYGKLGQMQESGRDIGHATMAAGLAIDLAHIGWNQGDDLFSYMDNRLAAGIEYVAAQIQSVSGLPWTNYHYGEAGFHWSDGRTWVQTGPALGEQIRPYWGTVIGHYEGVKGVSMPFSKTVCNKMGIDGGGAGSTSGGYDHMGYSVLMNTRNHKATAEEIPTLLTPKMLYNGQTIEHNELGGLKNTYATDNNTGLPQGSIVTLMPQLPEGEEDTGNWLWNTGETTKDITVVADKSYLYRATYTNANGVKSEQVFALAVQGDCEESNMKPTVTTGGKTVSGLTARVMYGDELTLSVSGIGGWGNFYWENGQTGSSITLTHVTSNHDISVIFKNQGGRKCKQTFHIEVLGIRPDIKVGNNVLTDTTQIIVKPGASIALTPTPSDALNQGTWLWSDGSTEPELLLENLQTSGDYTVSYTIQDGRTFAQTYHVYVAESSAQHITKGNYYVRHIDSDTYLTNAHGSYAFFTDKNTTDPKSQQWEISTTTSLPRYWFKSLQDGLYINTSANMVSQTIRSYSFNKPIGTELLAIYSPGGYWNVDENGTIRFLEEGPLCFPFELIEVNGGDGIDTPEGTQTEIIHTAYYSLNGMLLNRPQKGINIRQTTFRDGRTEREKVLIR